MKEHGLIFGAASMLGITRGNKTMTRRVVSFHNSTVNGPTNCRAIWNELDFDHAFVDNGPSSAGNAGPYLRVAFPKTDGFQELTEHECQYRVYPRVQVGDAIRCKEIWMPHTEDGTPSGAIIYKATDKPEPDGENPLRWRSPLFMPHNASRAFLPVTEVVAQRVQDITTEDIIAEGLSTKLREHDALVDLGSKWESRWNDVNADRGHPWSRNDWVWGYKWKEVTR